MTHVRERYRPQLLAVDAGISIKGPQLGGFIPKTDGAIKVATYNDAGAAVILVDEIPVTAGAYLPLPLVSPWGQNLDVVLSGGASGTLLI